MVKNIRNNFIQKNSFVYIATFAPFESGQRLPTNGMVEPLISFFSPKVKKLVVLIQPHTGSDFVSPFTEEYKNGKKEKEVTMDHKFWFPLYWWCKHHNQPRTLLSFKIRDFISVLGFGFTQNKQIDLFIGLESINTLAGIILRKFGKVQRVVYYVSDYSPHRFGDTFFNSFYVWLDRMAAQHADVIWDVSPAMQPARVSAGLKESKSAPVIIVPNGLYPNQIKAIPIDQRIPYSLVFMGSLGIENGPDVAVESLPIILKKFPKTTLHIIGGGEASLKRLKKLVHKLGVEKSVIFYGFVVSNLEMSKIVRQCSIGLAPYRAIPDSVRWYADATKIRQYLASGLPVVSSQVPPLGKVVASHGAALVAKDNKKDFSAAILKILEDKILYKKMEKQAQKLSQNNTWEKEYQKTMNTMATLFS